MAEKLKLFLFERKSYKKSKNLAGLSLNQFFYIPKLLAPPRAEILRKQNLLGGEAQKEKEHSI